MSSTQLPPSRSPWPMVLLVVALPALLSLACGQGPEGGDATDPGSPRSDRTGQETSAPVEGETPDASSAHPAATPRELDLPRPFLDLIRAEMQEIESAMQTELRHLARAEAAEGARVARGIHESFVLKQRMTDEERRKLRSLLPPTFLAFDKDFHGRAEQLAGAFERRDFTAAAELYSELARACVRCHSRYATERFSELRPGEASEVPEDAPSGENP